MSRIGESSSDEGSSQGPRGLHLNFVAIVLSVVSIIQGLAVTALAESLKRMHTIVEWSFYLLAFVVVIRLFQTYVSAAVDYADWQIRFSDVVFVFLLGLVQYQVIASLSETTFKPSLFEAWFSAICAAALLGYANAYLRLGGLSPKIRTKERRLQVLNFVGACVCLLLALPILCRGANTAPGVAILALSQASVIIANTSYSLRSTPIR